MRRIQLVAALLALVLTSAAQTWISRFNGPANSEDLAYGIGCDDSGRVFVTGTSWGSGSANDFLTIAYGQAGELSHLEAKAVSTHRSPSCDG